MAFKMMINSIYVYSFHSTILIIVDLVFYYCNRSVKGYIQVWLLIISLKLPLKALT